MHCSKFNTLFYGRDSWLFSVSEGWQRTTLTPMRRFWGLLRHVRLCLLIIPCMWDVAVCFSFETRSYNICLFQLCFFSCCFYSLFWLTPIDVLFFLVVMRISLLRSLLFSLLFPAQLRCNIHILLVWCRFVFFRFPDSVWLPDSVVRWSSRVGGTAVGPFSEPERRARRCVV